jgi:hypothetical protein
MSILRVGLAYYATTRSNTKCTLPDVLHLIKVTEGAASSSLLLRLDVLAMG